MYKVSVSNKSQEAKDPQEMSVEIKENLVSINDQPYSISINTVRRNYFQLIRNHKVYIGEILEIDHESKSVQLKVNGQQLNVKIQDKLDLLLDKLGFSSQNASQLSSIKAPMPGLILDIMVEEGQEVKKGDTVMILEAMKMENVIKSPGEGKVTKINVSTGQSVEKNSPLIQF